MICRSRAHLGELLMAALLIALCSAGPAHANGAFADSKAILLPHAKPHRIIASTDVPGLVVSDDDGASWSWICESAIGHFAALFQLGPEPDEQLYAITQSGLSISDDGACSWQRPDGITKRAGDVFPDPNDPQHVLAIAETTVLADSALYGDAVVQSNDGGASFGPAMFSTSYASITGIESARSDPSRIYLAMSTLDLQRPYLVRSTDAGATWSEINLTTQLDRKPLVIRILAVDPSDAGRLYIRVSDGIRDALAVSRDSAESVSIALQLDARMSAFVVRADGTLLLASSDGSAYRSHDAGASFEPWTNTSGMPHFQALAERDGVLYASTKSSADGFAVAMSKDDGEHWLPLLRLERLRGALACGELATQCEAEWTQLQRRLSVLSGPPLDPDPTAPPPRPAADGCSVLQPGSDSACSVWFLCATVLRTRRRFFTRAMEET